MDRDARTSAEEYGRDSVEFSRAIAFFDAVYAFAVTLLVVNIDPPEASEELIAETAENFNISTEAVRAALAYYDLNRAAIDAKFVEDLAAGQGRQPVPR